MTFARRLAPLAMMSLLAIAACRQQPSTQPTPDGGATPGTPGTPGTPTTAQQDSMRRAAEERMRVAREDSLRRAREEAMRVAREDSLRRVREAAMAAAANARNVMTTVIYFDFDRSELRGEAAAALDAKLPILRNNPNIRIRIDGHADERGSDEYNLALGMRRATAAKRYLTDRGIDAARIDVQSMGEERPTCTESSEACWAQNRRDEFTIVAGGDMIRP